MRYDAAVTPDDIMPGLRDPAPCFLCDNLRAERLKVRYRVPLINRPVQAVYADAPDARAATQALSTLPDISSTRQLRALLQNNVGFGLWAPKQAGGVIDRPASEHDLQLELGSLLIFPPNEWEYLRSEFAGWQFDGIDAAFDGLPYSFDDVIPFAGLNFSPDRWLLVLRGPMEGNVCWWTHDDESELDAPWALDVKAWADRIFAEAPGVLGGVVRFSARHSLESAPEDAELFPRKYRRDISAAGGLG